MRLSALIDEFLVDCRSRRLSPKTVSWYQANLRYFLNWLLAHHYPDDLSAFTLTNGRRYSQDLAERTARQGTFVGGAPRRGVYALVETDQRLEANISAPSRPSRAGWRPRSRATRAVMCWPA